MNNGIDLDNFYYGVLQDDGSYAKITKLNNITNITIKEINIEIRNKKKKYRKFNSLLKQRERHILDKFTFKGWEYSFKI